MISDLPLFAAPETPERSAIVQALDDAFDALPVGQCVTAESLRDKLSFSVRSELQIPTRRNLLGMYFRLLVKRGRVTHDGWQEASRDAARHRALRRWRKTA